MELQFEQLVGKITDFIKSEAKTETVIGEQFTLGEFMCVPVIKLGMGFGSGGGSGVEGKGNKGEGLGAGAGVGIEPVGFLVTRGEEISFLSAGKTKGLASVFEKIPDLMDKFTEKKNTKEPTNA